MADPIQTEVQSRDIPEYLRDYRSALLNAAFQSVFSKPFLQQNFPGATWYTAGQQAPATAAPSGATAGTPAGGDTRTDTQVPEDGTAKSASANKIANALAMVSGQMPKMLGMVWDPKTRTYIPEAYKNIATKGLSKGGPTRANNGTTEDIIRAYEELRKNMPVGLLPDIYGAEGGKSLTGGVTLPGGRNPFGSRRGPSQTSTYTTGTDFGTTLTDYNRPPDITTGTPLTIGTRVTGTGGGYGAAPGYGTGITGLPRVTTGGGGMGVVPGPSGGGTAGSGSAAGGVSGAPPIGTLESSAVLPVFTSGAAGTTEVNRGAGGYNPAQYATDQQAAGLASLLGGQVARTNVVGPVAPPPQNLIDFGDGAQLNAGLVQQALGNITVDGTSRARTPSEMTQSLAGLRAEIAAGGGDTSQIDRLIQQNTQAYASGATTSLVGQPAKPPASNKPGLGDAESTNVPPRRGGIGDLGLDRTSKPAVAFGGADEEPIAGRGSDVSGTRGGSEPATDTRTSGRGSDTSGTRGSGDSLKSLVDKGGVEVYSGQPSVDGAFKSITSAGYDPFARPDLGGFYSALRGADPTRKSSEEEDDFRYGMAGGGLARFEIGDDGKVRNYSRGGVIRKQVGGGFGSTQQPTTTGPNLLGFGTTQTPIAGGFGGTGGLSSLFGAVNPGTPSTGLFNPPPVYGGQRILGFGQDFGQYDPKMGFTASNLTTGALSGAGLLPSVFTQRIDEPSGRLYTEIEPESDFGKGVANINYATDLARRSAALGSGLAEQVGQQGQLPSYLMSMMPNIQQMGFEDAIKVAPITAPTLAAPAGVTAPKLESFQLEAPQAVVSERTGVSAFGRPQSEQYMSPYQEAVTEAQKREAIRQANMLKAGRSAAAVRAGAFGGSRQAIQEGMAEEALQRQLGDIEAVGRQKAYESAQAQFERDRAASLASQQSNVQAALQAALANQQAGLTAGRENLGARLGVQNLAAQQALQSQLANQQAGLTAGQANLQSALATQQLGTQSGLEAAKASQSGDLATWQMQLDAIKQASAEQEAARQRDFSNRLAALQQAQSGAAGLAGLGGTMMGIPGMAQQLELQRLAAMQQAGGAIDARTEAALNMAYQDFINQQNFPYQQMNFAQGILSGMPVGMQIEGTQFQRPDTAGGLASLAGSIPGLISAIRNK